MQLRAPPSDHIPLWRRSALSGLSGFPDHVDALVWALSELMVDLQFPLLIGPYPAVHILENDARQQQTLLRVAEEYERLAERAAHWQTVSQAKEQPRARNNSAPVGIQEVEDR